MKTKISLFVLVMAAALASLIPVRGYAEDAMLKKIRATCYCEHGITYSGCQTHEGIIAGRKEDIGKVAAIYAVSEDGSVGDFIGYFEIRDCGAGFDTDGDGRGDSTITGKTVDVFREDMGRVKDWIKTYGDYVYILIIDCEG